MTHCFTSFTKREAFLTALKKCTIYNKEYCIIACPMCAKPMFLRDREEISGKLNLLHNEEEVFEYCLKIGCNVTSKNLIEFDHFKPKSKGGNSSLQNCITICSKCNKKCSDKVTELEKYIIINSAGRERMEIDDVSKLDKNLVKKLNKKDIFEEIIMEKEENYLKYIEIFRYPYAMEEDE